MPEPLPLSPEETHYRLLKLIEAHPNLTQRELARALGISLGKANYSLKALVQKGWIEARRFRASAQKRAYAYLLTPSGLHEKAQTTARFLRAKMEEYERLTGLLEELREELPGIRRDSQLQNP